MSFMEEKINEFDDYHYKCSGEFLTSPEIEKLEDILLEQREKILSCLPEERSSEDCACVYGEGCGCEVADFNSCRSTFLQNLKEAKIINNKSDE